jgi:hypothetical protein
MSGSTGPVLTSGGRWRSLADAQTLSSGVTQIKCHPSRPRSSDVDRRTFRRRARMRAPLTWTGAPAPLRELMGSGHGVRAHPTQGAGQHSHRELTGGHPGLGLGGQPLASQLPDVVREALKHEAARARPTIPNTKRAVIVFYPRHVCRLEPWPDYVRRAFASSRRIRKSTAR